MNPLPGYRFVVAPHFHVPGDWAARVQLGTSTSWRAATGSELDQMVHDPAAPLSREALDASLCLFALPRHLHEGFWRLLEQARERGDFSAKGFDAFVAEVARFLAFKQMSPPVGAVFDLVVNQPDSSCDLTGEMPVWGLIHLGEGAASIVLSPGPDLPLLRIRIDPGEGVRLPAGLPVACGEADPASPELFLVVRSAGEPSASSCRTVAWSSRSAFSHWLAAWSCTACRISSGLATQGNGSTVPPTPLTRIEP
jgi:hypothetical protein